MDSGEDEDLYKLKPVVLDLFCGAGGMSLGFVKVLQPLYFVLENVPDMQSYLDGEGLLLEKALCHFREIGYHLVDWQILQADHYGVPQTRRRVGSCRFRGGSLKGITLAAS